MRDHRKILVESGYDRLGESYRDWVVRNAGGFREQFIGEVLSRLPAGTSVLELGCGPGTDAEALASGREYVAIDLSSVQLAHARTVVPHGVFIHDDFTETPLPEESFDAIVSLYVLNHLPGEELPEAFARVWGWLRPGGLFAASLSRTADSSVQRAWLGKVDMFFGGMSRDDNDRHLRAAGFELDLSKEVTEEEEGEGEATFHWVIAKKPSTPNSPAL